MNHGDLITNNLNALNILISKLLFIDIKITKEEKCISLFCSFPKSWDSLVGAIGSNNTTSKIDDVVT